MTTDGPEAVSQVLVDKATEFAEDITKRLHRVVRTTKAMSALLIPGRAGSRVMVGIVEGDDFGTFPLSIGDKHRLDLLLKFNCCLDSAGKHLAVESSWMHVTPKGDKAPLFRYEYVRDRPKGVPSGHLHVHGHRDEFAFMMQVGDRGRAKDRKRRHEVPRMATFHFPLGGHRFRPCMEDVLEAVAEEFCVDTIDEWRAAVHEGREKWRRTQLRSAVRDCPEEAAAVLAGELDYQVKPPTVMPKDNLERLRAY